MLWIAGYFLIPSDNVFHYGIHVLGLGLIVAAIILFLKPKDYDAQDVEVSGLYWHFVDLVWMFIFPLVYLMSTKITSVKLKYLRRDYSAHKRRDASQRLA